jgi:hypothetical protein
MPASIDTTIDQQTALTDLRRIPGVGKSIALDLWNLGVRSVAGLRGRDPEDLYARLCEQTGSQVDRCMLYTFRCAVYFASEEAHDPESLKWWNWTDERMARRRTAG